MQKLVTAALAATIAITILSGCAPSSDNHNVVLVAHDSFTISKELVSAFEKETGYHLKVVKAGDAGAMTNKLVLTNEQPIGDAVFGIDNTLVGLAKKSNLIDGELSAIDFGDVCMNYDVDWFAKHKIPAPTKITQLTDSIYQNLTVVENPGTSSTGMAFLATTIAKFGEDGYLNYWSNLKKNGVKIDAGWEDAYYTDFSGSSGHGKYPIVLSYSSSPADEVNTAAILNDCYRQTEYAGVLRGAKNSAGANALVKFMLSLQFQQALPGLMYVYPIDASVPLPATWAAKAPAASTLIGDKLDVEANRKDWLTAWSKIFE